MILILSLILVIMSAWSLNTFRRLSKANDSYDSSRVFEDSCHVSSTYVKGGNIIAYTLLACSIILLVYCLVKKIY